MLNGQTQNLHSQVIQLCWSMNDDWRTLGIIAFFCCCWFFFWFFFSNRLLSVPRGHSDFLSQILSITFVSILILQMSWWVNIRYKLSYILLDMEVRGRFYVLSVILEWPARDYLYNITTLMVNQVYQSLYSKTPLLRPPLCLRKNSLYSGVVLKLS